MALIFWKHTNQDKPWFDKSYINFMRLIFPEKELNIFISSFTSSVQDLSKKLSIRIVELDEWFQPVIFYKTPCILFDDAISPFGRPTLRRYFENILGDWLEEENSNCLQDYDSMIENYVKAGLQLCNVNFLDEKGINQLTSSSDRVCDFMIDESDGFVLIEVKNKALTKKTPSSSHPVPITSKLGKTIISGINQLDITLAKLKTLSKFNHPNYYQIIVTKNDLWLGNANAFSSNSNDVDPVWLLTLSDMDHFIELVRDKRTTFCSFFKDLAVRRKIPSESVFTVSMLLKKHPYKLNQIPSHLIVELDKLVDTIKSKTTYI